VYVSRAAAKVNEIICGSTWDIVSSRYMLAVENIVILGGNHF